MKEVICNQLHSGPDGDKRKANKYLMVGHTYKVFDERQTEFGETIYLIKTNYGLKWFNSIFFTEDIELGQSEQNDKPGGFDWLKFHRETLDKMAEITKRKNADYAGFAKNEPFANFELCEKMGIAKTEIGFLTRMTDKISRINSFTQKGELQVKDESVTDTLIDLANYCILFAGYLQSKREK